MFWLERLAINAIFVITSWRGTIHHFSKRLGPNITRVSELSDLVLKSIVVHLVVYRDYRHKLWICRSGGIILTNVQRMDIRTYVQSLVLVAIHSTMTLSMPLVAEKWYGCVQH